MMNNNQKGYTFLKTMVILTVAVVVICVGIPSIRTVAGQSGERACENNIETIKRLENEFFRLTGEHTTEYINLEIVNEQSDLFRYELLSKDDIRCRQTDGYYQWQNVDGKIVLVCSEH